MARRFISTAICGLVAASVTQAVPHAGLAAAAEAASAVAALVPSGAPLRRAGWWAFYSGADTSGPGDEQLCVGERSETVFSAFDQLAPKDWCTVRDFRRDGDGWAYSSVCDYGAGAVKTVGTIEGDLTSDYTVRLKVSGKTMGTREGTLAAQWVGPCPAGKKDGDRLVGGYTINVLDNGGL